MARHVTSPEQARLRREWVDRVKTLAPKMYQLENDIAFGSALLRPKQYAKAKRLAKAARHFGDRMYRLAREVKIHG